MTFKVTQLIFDDNEDVATVVAEVDENTYQVLSSLTSADLHIRVAKLGDGPRVSIPRDVAVQMFRDVGKVKGSDPAHRTANTVYKSLVNIMRMLDDNW